MGNKDIELDKDSILGVKTYSNNSDYKNFSIEKSPEVIKDEVYNFSENIGVNDEVIFDLMSPLFSKDTIEDYYDNFYSLEDYEIKIFENEGDNLSEENEDSDEELEKFQEKVDELKEKLEEKEETIKELQEKIKLGVIDEIIETRKEKNYYEDDEEVEDDRERLSKFSKEVLDELLEESKRIKVKQEKKFQSKVKETEKDFEEYETSGREKKKKDLYKKMFGEDR